MSPGKIPDARLSVCRCPIHNFWAISVDDADGCGTRITPEKCCGRWEVVASWPLTRRMVASIQEELAAQERLADEIGRQA